MNPGNLQQRRMVDLLEEIGAPEGARPSLLPSIHLLRTTRPTPPVPVLYDPCLVIVAQGRKRFHLPDRVVTYDNRNFLMLTVPTPADCETIVAADGPFLGMVVRLDLTLLSDLLMNLGAAPSRAQAKKCPAPVSAPPMTPVLSEVSIRLLECLRSPMDAKILGPQLVRELTYRVLCSEDGGVLHDLLLAHGGRAAIHRILHRMHTEFTAPLDVPSLAHEAAMSVSALHAHFKAVTATSPVQYLKRVRLHKARMLMVQDAVGVSAAAERVGYESPSQFSREFKRLFGAPPADETQRVRATFGFSA